MSLWEYKVITSGRGGFATPALLEKFLNDLGRDEWEIIQFHTQPDNPLAFNGMARRTTQRDWTLEDAAAAAARTEADKLRAEFEAKFKSAGSGTAQAPADEKPQTIAGEKIAADDGMRRLRDTTRDLDPDADEEEPKDDWDKVTAEDELPTFFDAIRPDMRRNQRGPGMAVGIEYLAKKWNLDDNDVKGALLECGFPLPEDEDSRPVYIEYEGDLYWLNINRRGELWINTKEKPRPVFRVVQGTKLAEPVEDAASTPTEAPRESPRPDAEAGVFVPSRERENAPAPAQPNRPERQERAERPERNEAKNQNQNNRNERSENKAQAAPVTLPTGEELLTKIRPLMRRNRRGAGGSGSTVFLARGLKCAETDLMTAFTTMGLTLSDTPTDKPINMEFGSEIWWLNKDSRGGVWINGREKEAGETAANAVTTPSETQVPANGTATTTEAMTASSVPQPESSRATEETFTSETISTSSGTADVPSQSTELKGAPLPALRVLLKETKTGSFAGKVDRLAEEIGKSTDEIVSSLTAAGLKVPEKSREKPVFVEHAGEIFWLNKNAKDELWLNAKASKFASGESGTGGEVGGAKKSAPPRRTQGQRSRKKDDVAAGEG